MSRITKILVANRGEIAIRILRAASELRIRTVAIYTYEDRYSLHRYKADESYQIGPREEALKPYLDIDEIIELAVRNGVDAIHPGYGFLSENVEFAKRCGEQGIRFIGPSHTAMEKLGNKVHAKRVAVDAGVPVIEESKEPLTSVEIAKKEAKRIGFPVMLKAAAGGGGRGMRVIRDEKALDSLFDEARKEAERAFGSGEVFLEKYISNPKHIEVQILGDHHGNIVHLFERDCSVQRRFQKVIEVAPAFTIDQSMRKKLWAYATTIAKAVDYTNAGTVEFLIDEAGEIYFIEVNPRIQVEHTVTEEVTGIDLVRTQILITEGKALASEDIGIPSQSAIQHNGFAIQCRITTENPEKEFVPDYGRIITYRSPGGFGIRLDAGSAYSGAVISPFFDSLLVKITASGRSFEGTISRLSRALREFRVRGVKTNIPFLLNVINHEEFISGKATVNFIGEHPEVFKFSRGQDRANKVIQYLAHVNVNGNPDVKERPNLSSLRRPRVPSVPLHVDYPNGSKNQLRALGRKPFCEWLLKEKRVLVTDTTMRDAHQSLLATRMRTIDMTRVADGFAKENSELFSLEMWGGATFDVSMRFLKECPWDRLIKIREAVPNILLQMLIRGSNAVGYSAYPDNLIVAFIEESSRLGMDVFRIFDSMNWIPAMEKSIETVNERTEALAEACVCYTGDCLDPKENFFTVKYYVKLAKELENRGAHLLCIKDMAGLLKPAAATELIKALKQEIGIPIHLHTHDTSSLQVATYLAAVNAGVDIVDCALASMSGLTSQPNMNAFAASLDGHERDPKLNLDSLNNFSNYWGAIRDCYSPFESGLRAGTAEVYEHEIPGGQYSNLQPQARALGLADNFDVIKRNYIAANRILGGLIKVTPSSKVVGDLALFMASNGLTEEEVLEKAAELSFPESVKGFLRGDLGQPPKGFPKAFQEAVLKGEQPISGRPNEHLEPVNLEAEYKDHQERYPLRPRYCDYLSHKLYPKVFEEFMAISEQFGDLSVIPSPSFFYGLPQGKEVRVEIAPGKKLIIEFEYVTEPDAEGKCTAYFKLNGQSRGVEVFDETSGITRKSNPKANGDGEIGAPLQGKLSAVQVKVGQVVKKGDPLFVIEAMKMETSVEATQNGKVEALPLTVGSLVEAKDLIVKLAL
ncbi:MAG: pyruvate carboxylase [Bdellovibrionales bacterium]|nr:pyruvate carboxylase [Bdellovibrionales bacterium]